MKVLIADDNITDLNGIRDFIPWDKLDCEVVATARNGVEGISMAAKTNPDLIIADISMPGMDGISMCKKIKKDNPRLQVIFLSCLEDFEYAKQAINLGNCDYITKPIDIDLIIQSILKMKNTHDDEIKKELTIFNLENEIKKNRPQLIKSFLKDIILGSASSENFLHRKAKEFDIDLNAEYMEILFETTDNSENSSLSSLLCSNLINTMLLDKFSGWAIDIKLGTIAVIISDEVDFNNLVDILGTIQYNFLEICEAELTICIGSTNIPFSQLHSEYERLCSTVNDNLFYTPNSIVLADDFHNQNTYHSSINFSKLDNDISTAIASEYDDAVHCLVDKYIPKDNPLLAKSTSCYIAINLNMILHKMNITSEILYIDNFLSNIMSLKTHSQIKTHLTDMIFKCKDVLMSNPNTATDYITDKIIKTINKEYASIQTIEDITDKLYLNAMYANRIFKQKTGKTIYEYLLQVRMEKAIELLKFSSLKAYKVGETVGYKTARYFSTVFKKHTGYTPGQYRAKFSNNILPADEE